MIKSSQATGVSKALEERELDCNRAFPEQPTNSPNLSGQYDQRGLEGKHAQVAVAATVS